MDFITITTDFRNLWANVLKTDPNDLINPLLKDHWATLTSEDPDFKTLAESLVNCFHGNPHLAILCAYLTGMARGVDGLLNETLHVEQGRLPEWLDSLVLEDLATRYSDKH